MCSGAWPFPKSPCVTGKFKLNPCLCMRKNEILSPFQSIVSALIEEDCFLLHILRKADERVLC